MPIPPMQPSPPEQPENPDTDAVRAYLLDLQDRLCAALAAEDGGTGFREDAWQRPGGGGGRSRIIEGGAVLERGGVNFSDVTGSALPPTATATRPELAGRAFQAMGVSLVVHPRNPYVPTSHLNVRFFIAEHPGEAPVWWFGGGFDLTPYYGFDDDVRHWHRGARAACAGFGEGLGFGPGEAGDAALHARLKADCDRYFFLKHRNEPRGVGGLFFDDLNQGGFGPCLGFTQAVAEQYLAGYLPIVQRRKDMAWGERERAFQCYRRGRYVEFNLVWDRGTLFGLQSGGRAESILMSMPPEVTWRYDWRPEPDSPEAALYDRYLVPRDWLAA